MSKILVNIAAKIASSAKWGTLTRLERLPLLHFSHYAAVSAPVAALGVLVLRNSGSAIFAGVRLPEVLLLLYVASLLYLIAGILVQIFCPARVKSCETFEGYIRFLAQIATMTQNLIPYLDKGPNPEEETPLHSNNAKLTDVHSKYIAELYLSAKKDWEFENVRAPAIRWLTLLLFCSSMCISGYVAFVMMPGRVFSAI